MIRNAKNLAAHLGADYTEDLPRLAKNIERRVYKDTECGCSAGVNGVVKTTKVVYFLWIRARFDGKVSVVSWRRKGKRKNLRGPMPAGLRLYVGARIGAPIPDATLGQILTANRVIKREGSDALIETPPIEEETAQGLAFWIAGYCEGTDRECPVYHLDLPCTEKALDDLIAKADQDGQQLWDETHGCPNCGAEGEDGDYAINPECPTCKGQGQIL